MLCVVFSVESERYALDVAAVTKILPLASLTALPAAAPEIAGVLNYQGSVIPVIDVHYVVSGRQCPSLLGTRIVLVRHPTPDGDTPLLGLRVPRLEIHTTDQADAFLPDDLPMPRWLERLLVSDGELVHKIRPEALVSDQVAVLSPAPDLSTAETKSGHGDSTAN